MRHSKSLILWTVLILLAGITFISFRKDFYSFNGKRLGKEISFGEVYSKTPNEIAKLRIRNGTNGEAYITDDSEKIQEFLELMGELTFIRAKDQRHFVGWSYYVDLIDDNEEKSWFRITYPRVSFALYSFNSSTLKSPYYQMEADFDITEKLDDFFSSMQLSGIALP